MNLMVQCIPAVDDAILAPLSGSERETFMSLLGKLVSENNELSRAPQDLTKHRS